MKENIWKCKIGGRIDQLPSGADAPMRNAVEAAFRTLTGVAPDFIFSGWSAELTPGERDVVNGIEPAKEAVRKRQQHTPCQFSPISGEALTSMSTPATFFRTTGGCWGYNPWTGERRHALDVETDPLGLLIIPPGEPVYAAPKPAQEAKPTALQRQEGGGHYKDLKIQPIEYIHANNIPFAEGCAIKYLTRWRSKGGIEDLKKARHFIDLLIELETRSKT